MKTFTEFLLEVNYGALETDERIQSIHDALIDNMIKTVDSSDEEFDIDTYRGVVKLEVPTKYKNTIKKAIVIRWKIITYESTSKTDIYRNAIFIRVDETKEIYDLTLECHKYMFESIKQYKTDLRYFLKKESDIYLCHEIKHLLDSLDGIFTKKHHIKYTHATIDSTDKEKQKYVSQDSERQSMLITAIKDVLHLKMDNPEYSFDDAIEHSEWYQRIMKHTHPTYRNKLKTKVAYAWYINFEEQTSKYF